MWGFRKWYSARKGGREYKGSADEGLVSGTGTSQAAGGPAGPCCLIPRQDNKITQHPALTNAPEDREAVQQRHLDHKRKQVIDDGVEELQR